MKKIIKLSESQLSKIVKKIINEVSDIDTDSSNSSNRLKNLMGTLEFKYVSEEPPTEENYVQEYIHHGKGFEIYVKIMEPSNYIMIWGVFSGKEPFNILEKYGSEFNIKPGTNIIRPPDLYGDFFPNLINQIKAWMKFNVQWENQPSMPKNKIYIPR